MPLLCSFRKKEENFENKKNLEESCLRSQEAITDQTEKVLRNQLVQIKLITEETTQELITDQTEDTIFEW